MNIKVVTIRNSGEATLNISSIFIEKGINFKLVDNSGNLLTDRHNTVLDEINTISLEPGNTYRINIGFFPTGADEVIEDDYTDNLIVNSDAQTNPLKIVPITAKYQKKTGIISVNPKAPDKLDFGAFREGVENTQTFNISNIGNYSFNIINFVNIEPFTISPSFNLNSPSMYM